MAFDPKWPHGHVTRDGRKARIICTDAKLVRVGKPCPIAFLVADPDNGHGCDGSDEKPYPATIDGTVPNFPGTDLLNAPAPKRKVRVRLFVNVYGNPVPYSYASREAADYAADDDRIACIEIDREVEEGEGL